MKIGVFDSGIGGITVLSEVKKRFSGVDYVYLGDTAHVPYGTKSPPQIEKLSVSCAQILKEKNIDALVVACNTASSLALEAIQQVMNPIPVFGVVGPGVEAALAALIQIQEKRPSAPILVLATRATVRSQAYGKSLNRILEPGWGKTEALPSTPVIEQACPLLVPMIEEGWIDHSILHQTIAEYVRPHLQSSEPGVALLGCTHYPWIHAAFEKALPGWVVVNSAWAVAELLEKSQLVQKGPAGDTSSDGQIEWIFTDPEAVPGFARKFINNESGKK